MTHLRFQKQFGFTPPEDFYLFWEFASSIAPKDPIHAFRETAMISLAGPFDILAGRFDNEPTVYTPCLHWRYFADTPEFCTILTRGRDGLHWGYVISPEGQPEGIAGYYAHDDVTIFQESSNAFGVLWNTLNEIIDQIEEDIESSPELAKDDTLVSHATQCATLLEQLEDFCASNNFDPPAPEELSYIDHCNPPGLSIPDTKDSSKLPGLVHDELEELRSQGFTQIEAELQVGRFLWHWHDNGNPEIEEIAFGLLANVYRQQGATFMQYVLAEHRKHRHRKSLDVFVD